MCESSDYAIYYAWLYWVYFISKGEIFADEELNLINISDEEWLSAGPDQSDICTPPLQEQCGFSNSTDELMTSSVSMIMSNVGNSLMIYINCGVALVAGYLLFQILKEIKALFQRIVGSRMSVTGLNISDPMQEKISEQMIRQLMSKKSEPFISNTSVEFNCGQETIRIIQRSERIEMYHDCLN